MNFSGMHSSTEARYELLITPLPLDLTYDQGPDALNALFERFGTIARAEIRSEGWHAFALVEFHSQLAALRALYEAHGSLVGGTRVSVSWSEASLRSFKTRYDVRVEQHPWNLEKSMLVSLFARYGPTLIDVVVNPVTTTAKAFAYVHFAQAEAVQRAIDELDGIDFGGAEVSVSWQWTLSRPGKELVVRFLPYDVSIRTVRNLFSDYGRLTNVDIARDGITNGTIGTVYVQFLNGTNAERAIDALDGDMMSRGPIRIAWARASRPSGYVVHVVDLAEIVDRRMLKKVFSRYGVVRCLEVDYDVSTGRSKRTAFVTFADREEAQAVIKDFGGRLLRNGEGVICMPIDRLNGELERAAAIEAEAVSGASDSALPRSAIPDLMTYYVTQITPDVRKVNASMDLIDLDGPSPPQLHSAVVSPVEASYVYAEKRVTAAETLAAPDASGSALSRATIPDLLTDSGIQITANAAQVDASVDLIDLSDPSPLHSVADTVTAVEVGYIYAEKREFEIPVNFYAVPESEKLEKAMQVLLTGDNAEQDENNNACDERNTKVTLVVCGTPELVEAMRRINAAGVDCWMCDDLSAQGGHSFRPSALMTVNVTTAPVCEKVKYSQHVVFLSPVDDPEDLGAAMDAMMLQRTDVNLVSVLFDDSDDHQHQQVSMMLDVLR